VPLSKLSFVARMPTDKLGLLFLEAGEVVQPDPDRLDAHQTHAGQRGANGRAVPKSAQVCPSATTRNQVPSPLCQKSKTFAPPEGDDRREVLKMLDHLAAGDVVTVRGSATSRAAPSTCSPSALGPPPREDPVVAVSGYQRRNTGT